MKLLEEFKAFAIRGNVIDLAVGVVIGGAFGTIVKSLVDDVIMPPIGLLIGNVDFTNLFFVLKPGIKQAGPYVSLAAAKQAGAVTLNIGLFVNAMVSFTIVAFSIFMLLKLVNRMQREQTTEQPATQTTKICTHCKSEVHIEATRCAHCTSALD
ncbi:large-conductance mechanosensitive channel protein MscL [Paludibacterium purpuratum]|uniref:Large-conductance mechanosensitive channel n=1 Tax=Paludibacterium purpuratum TaxID=1144873 RepID=A0A4R7AZJ7_9NEIS|nr:large-conductance mechanosensitive channel protein MscL [Paludibacterium purpuratum]TDR73865.1 large conductance mechanosensitive channel [Paludibacterium purpuratum]